MRSAMIILLFFFTAVRGAGLSCTHNNDVANTFLGKVFEKYRELHEQNVNIPAMPQWETLEDDLQLKAMCGNLAVAYVNKHANPKFCSSDKQRHYIDGIRVGPLEATWTAQLRKGSTILSPNCEVTGSIGTIDIIFEIITSTDSEDFVLNFQKTRIPKPLLTVTGGPKEVEENEYVKKLIMEVMKRDLYSFVKRRYVNGQVKNNLLDALLNVTFPEDL